jgi:3-oxoacyl-[acyl-carrier protein] reductase
VTTPERRLEGRRALITGGSGGLGGAIAEELAREGAEVAICGRDRGRLEQVAATVSAASGGRVVRVVTLDLAETGAAERTVAAAAAELGGIDILVNGAGAPADGRLEDLPGEAWRRSFEIKVFGAFDMARLALSHLRQSKAGVIVTLSGSLGREPTSGNIVSGAMNAALENGMKALASDLAAAGIRVVTVRPGPFETERIVTMMEHRSRREGISMAEARRLAQAAVPLARFGRPEELARLVAFVVSDDAAFLTGTVVALDGGGQRSV